MPKYFDDANRAFTVENCKLNCIFSCCWFAHTMPTLSDVGQLRLRSAGAVVSSTTTRRRRYPADDFQHQLLHLLGRQEPAGGDHAREVGRTHRREADVHEQRPSNGAKVASLRLLLVVGGGVQPPACAALRVRPGEQLSTKTNIKVFYIDIFEYINY